VRLDIYLGNVIPVLTGGYTVYVAAIAFKNKVRGGVINLAGLLAGRLQLYLAEKDSFTKTAYFNACKRYSMMLERKLGLKPEGRFQKLFRAML